MTADPAATRRERRIHAREEVRSHPRPRRPERARSGPVGTWTFGLLTLGVLALGGYLAFADLGGQRGEATSAGAIPVRMSMAGFTPVEVRVPAGQTIALELWTNDAPVHLEGGVHTLISEALGVYEELPGATVSGESRRIVTIPAPATPGTYDIYCDTCCGGKDSPTMHGRLIVEA
ncbi:MAG TPA: cupredoxin domain-containing protein [Candidatus Limnocylindrales bacterium]|nr:cupredoxin domain-containing protein [Candidatus Limnocylindrales bacterium]